MVEIDINRAHKNLTHHYKFTSCIALFIWIVMIFSEAMRTEADYVTDSLVLFMLLLTFF